MRNQSVILTVCVLLLTFLTGFTAGDGGVGIKIRQESNGAFTISEIVPEGPAEQAGLIVGEEIKGVNGVTISRNSLEEVVGMVRGPVGSEVTLTLQHSSYPNMRNVKLQRYTLPIKAIDRIDVH